MENNDVDACMKAFGNLCDNAERDEFVSVEDCQYWVFERGYKAAMEEMIKRIKSGQVEQSPLQLLQIVTRKPAIH